MAKIYDINKNLIYESEHISKRKTVMAAIKEGVCLKNADLSHTAFTHLDLEGVDLSGANLSWCFFTKVSLIGVNMSGADIHDTVFRETSFCNVDMSKADIRDTDFRDSDLITVNFLGAVLSYDSWDDDNSVRGKLRKIGGSSRVLRSGDWLVGLSKDIKPSQWSPAYPNVYVVKRLPSGGFKDNSKDILRVLSDRGRRYGSFEGHAAISQALQKVVAEGFANREDGKTIQDMTDAQREALFMVLHKVARIVNGDFNYDDSWRDIAGYATLVANELEGKND